MRKPANFLGIRNSFCDCQKSLPLLFNFHPLISLNELITPKTEESRTKKRYKTAESAEQPAVWECPYHKDGKSP
jgi:hypothetical protein